MKRLRGPSLTFAMFSIVLALATTIIRIADNLHGPAGFAAFILLIVGCPLVLGIGATWTAWELMDRFLPKTLRVPERLLLSVAAFVVTCGCSPLAITPAVMFVTQRDASMGAIGVWALIGLVIGGLFCFVAISVFLLRLALYRGEPKHS